VPATKWITHTYDCIPRWRSGPPGPPETRGTSSKFTKMAPEDGQVDPKMAQDSPKMVSMTPRWPKKPPRCSQDGPQPKMAPRLPQDSPTWPRDSPRWPPDNPRCQQRLIRWSPDLLSHLASKARRRQRRSLQIYTDKCKCVYYYIMRAAYASSQTAT
jgi:hypothetical protein